MAEERFCPKCGAYWACSCALEDLSFTPDSSCEHDWTAAVGVELTEDYSSEDAQVFLCRLCGIYAVSDSSTGLRER